MANELTKRAPMDLAQMETAATVMAKSGLFPVWNTTERVMTLMMLCRAEGIDPLSGVNRYDYINGRIAKKATAIQADFQSTGGKVEWLECTNEKARVKLTTPEGLEHIEEFTLDDARRAQLVKPNSGWTKYPKAMLRARCITFAIRAISPQSLNLMLSSEEAMDADAPREINVTPEATPEVEITNPLIKEEVKEEKHEKPAKTTKKKAPAMKNEKVVEAEVVEEKSESSPYDNTKKWLESIGIERVNAFLKSINWDTVDKLTESNLQYIEENKESFEKNVIKFEKGE